MITKTRTILRAGSGASHLLLVFAVFRVADPILEKPELYVDVPVLLS